MMVKIEKKDSMIKVKSPYNKIFVDSARNLAGKWNGSEWEFDARDESDVRHLCMKVYGTDGKAIDQCDVKVTIDTNEYYGGEREPIILFGNVIARAFGRDSGAKIGEGVKVVSGGFNSGGSMKNWRTTVKNNTSFVMRDVSRIMVEEHENPAFKIEVLDVRSNITDNNSTNDDYTDALIAELEQIEARKKEIIKLLAGRVSQSTAAVL